MDWTPLSTISLRQKNILCTHKSSWTSLRDLRKNWKDLFDSAKVPMQRSFISPRVPVLVIITVHCANLVSNVSRAYYTSSLTKGPSLPSLETLDLFYDGISAVRFHACEPGGVALALASHVWTGGCCACSCFTRVNQAWLFNIFDLYCMYDNGGEQLESQVNININKVMLYTGRIVARKIDTV